MDFFIRDDNVRPGNRGGRDQFKWDDIRMMNNKERESYLGVSQSIGFLDKGGKWRKRDWWQSYRPDNTHSAGVKGKEDILAEKARIQMEEKQMLKDAIYGTGNKKGNEQQSGQSVQPNKKLTDFQWEKMMKKETKLNPNDAQVYDYYDDDNKRAGLGMKSIVSFRTNPYDKSVPLSKLEGEGEGESITKDNKDTMTTTPALTDPLVTVSNKKESKLKKYIQEYVHNKHKSLGRSRSRSRSLGGKHNDKDKDHKYKHKHSHKHKHH